MKYLLDTNVFIEAKNRYYAFDICPGFWSWMDTVCGESVGSIISVQDELTRGDDDLSQWAKDRRSAGWFLAVDDEETQINYSNIVSHVSQSGYTQPAIDKFLSDADSWIIAKSLSIGATVVTHERPDPRSKKRILIPDVCNEFNVPFINTFDALRTLSAQFHL